MMSVRSAINVGRCAYSQKCFQIYLFLNVAVHVGECSSGWSCYLSQCYYVSTDRVNQSTALTRCQSENAELVSISDVAENDFVKIVWSVYQLI